MWLQREREEHNASLLWPCFIVASEALDRTVQDRLFHWLRGMFDDLAHYRTRYHNLVCLYKSDLGNQAFLLYVIAVTAVTAGCR